MDKKSGLNITVSKVRVADILDRISGGIEAKFDILLSAVNNISEIKYTGIKDGDRLVSGTWGNVIEWDAFIEMPLEMGNIEWKGYVARN